MALFSRKQKQSELPRRRQWSGDTNERASETSLDERYSFRRNRTLTGSSSSQVSSLSESNAQLKSPRVQAHELTRQRRHVGGILFLVLLGMAVLYGLISQMTANVIVRTAEISQTLDPHYADIIQSYLSSQPIERLRFMVNRDHLNQYIQERAPEVAAVNVDGSGGLGKSIFVLTMRRPLVGWKINGQQEYVDSTGTSFAHNYYPSPSVQIVDKSGVHIQAGQAVASDRFLGFVGRAVALAEERSYTVNQVIIPEGTTRQVELRLKGISYPVKLSIDRGVGEQVEDMARAVKWLHDHHKSPKYLDVRVSGEAFYR